jgi:tetratricopeptide (TPR) repeat protein
VEALILYVREKDLDLFYDAAERAIALNPNNAFILADLGLWMVYSGRFERGKALVEKSVALNPLHADWIHFASFLDHYRKGEYREALGVQLKMNVPNNQGIQAGLAAVYAQLGDMEKAKATLAHILQHWPEFAKDPRAWFVRRRFSPAVLESLMDGLRKAGLEVPPRQQLQQ